MDKEENLSSRKDRDKPEAKPAAQNNQAKGGTPATSDIKTKKKKSKRRRLTLSERVAIIGSATTVIVAMLGFQPLINWLNSHITPTSPATITTSSVMPLITNTQTFLPTETSTSVPLPSLTYTPEIFVPPSETATIEPAPVPKLIVLLTASKSSGKAPLRVKFDARESYLTDYDGQRYVCRNGPCNYIWKIYSNGEQIGKSKTDSGGTLDYSFGKKGTYTVSVWICRGQDKIDCGGSSIQVAVS